MIGDEWTRQLPQKPYYPQMPNSGDFPEIQKNSISQNNLNYLLEELKHSKEKTKALKKDLKSLRKLLKAAMKFDKETGQPDCHVDEKVGIIKKLADEMNVNMKGILY